MSGNNNSYSTIQGLNLVYPPADDSTTTINNNNSNNHHSNTLSTPSEYPDFTAQLDLWTNLSFASDEPVYIDDRSRDSLDFRNSSVDMDKEHPQSVLIADTDKLPSSLRLDAPTTSLTPILPPSSGFDLSSFLAGFGIDPFLVPPDAVSQSETETQQTQRASKRPRTRKSSMTSSTTSAPAPSLTTSLTTPTAPSSNAGSPPATSRGRATSEVSEDPGTANAANLSTAEDKRRRNTAASARFRAKKKEREQAMERRSKELESRVNELERECEGLRRENGWLKGLVVGVTSGNPGPIPTIDEPPSPVITTAALSDSTKKRKREATHE